MSVIFREERDKLVCYFEGRFGRRNDGINLSVIFRGALHAEMVGYPCL